jgi:RNA polymerase sigma factor (TIGR02999 family)
MTHAPEGELTELKSLLDAARRGEKPALDELFALMYRELHHLAHARLARDRASPVLDTTSLVHESYLRCLKAHALDLADRAHFLAYAAKVMRSIVVDVARSLQAERRGGDAAHLTLDTDLAESMHVSADQLVGIDDALHDLSLIDERLVHVVEMRFFAGLTEQEVAQALGVTERTIRRDWEKARILLRAALS